MASPSVVPERSIEDILEERVVLVLAGERYVLRVLPRRANRAWLASIEGRLAALLESIRATDDVASIMTTLVGGGDDLWDLLYSYDVDGVLPPRDEAEDLWTDQAVLRAVMEVWQAANPLVGMAITGLAASLIAGSPSEPTSSPSPRGGTQRGRSRRN